MTRCRTWCLGLQPLSMSGTFSRLNLKAMWALAVLGHFCLLAPWIVVMRQVEPYMDEIFHIPQAQRYCQGKLSEWDPKITTFPGLYFLSSMARGFSNTFCDKDSLRLDNMAYALGTHVIMYRLLRRRLSPERAAGQALLLSLYPIHFFFQALYYTDVGSLFWTLLTHDLAMPRPGQGLPSRSSCMLAAVAGGVAILFRQTNAVWLMFTFGTACLHDLQTSKWGSALEHVSMSGLLLFPKALLLESPRLLQRLGPLLLPVLAFLCFVVWNGSIVVGDHLNHQAASHWAQLAYLLAVTAATSSSAYGFSTLRSFSFALAAHPVAAGLTVLFIGLLLNKYTLAHPFLLADNRHYTFYIWNRFLKRPWLKEALSPGYFYAAWFCWRRHAAHWLWLLIWFVASALTLVSAPLLEPRYWTTAVLMAHLHSPTSTTRREDLALGSAFMLINIVTLGVFVYRPFTWPSGEAARFMW